MVLEIPGKQPLPAPWQQLTEAIGAECALGVSDAAHHSVFPKGIVAVVPDTVKDLLLASPL